MSSLLSKLADHPNTTSDPATNPSKGVTGAPAAVRDDNDPTRSSPANWVAKGQGGERKFGNDEYQAKAGSMSSPDTAVPAQETLPSPERMRELEASVRR